MRTIAIVIAGLLALLVLTFIVLLVVPLPIGSSPESTELSSRFQALNMFTDFSRPILQIGSVLVIVAVLGASGAIRELLQRLEWNTRTVLAAVVVLSLCFAVLAGIAIPNVFQDVALVVIGYFFGSQLDRGETRGATRGATRGTEGRTEEASPPQPPQSSS